MLNRHDFHASLKGCMLLYGKNTWTSWAKPHWITPRTLRHAKNKAFFLILENGPFWRRKVTASSSRCGICEEMHKQRTRRELKLLFDADGDENCIRCFAVQQSSVPSPTKKVCIVISSSSESQRRLSRQGKDKLAETDRRARGLLRARAWQRSDPHESLLRSESYLHLGMQIHSHLPSPSPLYSLLSSPPFILASSSLKLLIVSFTPARAPAHLGKASTTRADFLINGKFTLVHTVLHSPTGQNNELRRCVGVW